MGIWIGTGALVLAAAFAGCSSLSGLGGSHIDCNIVRLQSQSGRSNAEIASALGVSESDVAACPAAGPVVGAEGGGGSGGPPNASEYGIPAGLDTGSAASSPAAAPSPAQ
ncbi:MAG TPA: AsnC family protein [Candidatus Binataceae bacterium]|nr:AsnC family protein [Candidatus Binataceae bacterium]